MRSLIVDLWQRTRIDWAIVTRALEATFRARRELGSEERRFVAETLYGLIRNLRRIDEALRDGGLRGASAAPDEARLLAYLILEAGLSPEDAARQAPQIDWQAVAAIDERLGREPQVARRIALRHSLPDWLATLLCAELGDEAEAVVAALDQRAPMTVRANLLLGDRATLAEALAAEGLETRPGRHAAAALHVETRTNLFGLKAFREGRFEAQDEGSQLCAELVAPPPKAIVVDYCAGAGGKTLALAAMMNNKGRIVATDIDARKLEELRRRARRAQVTTVQTAALDEAGSAPALARLEGTAHRVLVDAPCSGVGALRRNPEARWRLTETALERLPRQQDEILARAMRLVREGGRVIYATCTILEAENQAVVERALAASPGFELVPVKEIWGSERAAALGDGTYLRLLPNRHGTDGFFAAVLRRRR